MKHITYSDKNLLTGDDAADMLVRYAAVLANTRAADTVSLECIGADGDAVTATFLVGEGAPLMIETATGKLAEPDNAAGLSYMRAKIDRLSHPPQARADEAEWESGFDRTYSAND